MSFKKAKNNVTNFNQNIKYCKYTYFQSTSKGSTLLKNAQKPNNTSAFDNSKYYVAIKIII